jgi:hypothetical protein
MRDLAAFPFRHPSHCTCIVSFCIRPWAQPARWPLALSHEADQPWPHNRRSAVRMCEGRCTVQSRPAAGRLSAAITQPVQPPFNAFLCQTIEGLPDFSFSLIVAARASERTKDRGVLRLEPSRPRGARLKNTDAQVRSPLLPPARPLPSDRFASLSPLESLVLVQPDLSSSRPSSRSPPTMTVTLELPHSIDLDRELLSLKPRHSTQPTHRGLPLPFVRPAAELKPRNPVRSPQTTSRTTSGRGRRRP